MRVGVFAGFGNPSATPEFIRAVGEASEERGFHSLWVGEHVVLFDAYDSRYPYAADGRAPFGGESGMLEPFTALTFLAAATSRIRLGTGVCLVPQRNPVYTAKQVADLDWVSGGRFDFGVGVGWLAEEFRALGVPFERRGERCRAYVEVMRRLWCDAVSSYEGEFYSLPACRMYPKPVQRPHPPIHFGGESDVALRRVADLGQGWHGFNLEPAAAAERIATLERLLSERGRKRGDVLMTICPYLRPVDEEAVKRYRDAGVDQLVMLVVGANADDFRRRLDTVEKSVLMPAGAA